MNDQRRGTVARSSTIRGTLAGLSMTGQKLGASKETAGRRLSIMMINQLETPEEPQLPRDIFGGKYNEYIGVDDDDNKRIIQESLKSWPNEAGENWIRSNNAFAWAFGLNKHDELGVKSSRMKNQEKYEQLPQRLRFDEDAQRSLPNLKVK